VSTAWADPALSADEPEDGEQADRSRLKGTVSSKNAARGAGERVIVSVIAKGVLCESRRS
jgi:hypothetical protein